MKKEYQDNYYPFTIFLHKEKYKDVKAEEILSLLKDYNINMKEFIVDAIIDRYLKVKSYEEFREVFRGGLNGEKQWEIK